MRDSFTLHDALHENQKIKIDLNFLEIKIISAKKRNNSVDISDLVICFIMSRHHRDNKHKFITFFLNYAKENASFVY